MPKRKEYFHLLIAGLVIAFANAYLPDVFPADLPVETIQAEDYGEGGEGVAYHDTTTANSGNAGIRTKEGVDLWLVDGTIKVGSVKTGEWLQYVVGFPLSGGYTLRFFLSTPNDAATADIFINDEKVGTLTAPNTGDYKTFVAVPLDVDVPAAGNKVLKVVFTGDSVDFDRVEIKYRPGAGFITQDQATHYGETDQKITVSWDPVDGADYYNVALINVEKGAMVTAGEGKTGTEKITFALPYSGHFVFKVRACINPVGDADPVCSSWTLSTDAKAARVGEENRGWWVYGHPAPPGSIDIQQH